MISTQFESVWSAIANSLTPQVRVLLVLESCSKRFSASRQLFFSGPSLRKIDTDDFVVVANVSMFAGKCRHAPYDIATERQVRLFDYLEAINF